MPSLGNYDLLAEKPVSRERINEIRNRLEVEPIQVGEHLVDCDPTSIERMRSAIEAFEQVCGEDGLVTWVMSDNSIKNFDRSGLEKFYGDVIKARAARGAELHRKALEFKSRLPGFTERDLKDGGW